MDKITIKKATPKINQETFMPAINMELEWYLTMEMAIDGAKPDAYDAYFGKMLREAVDKYVKENPDWNQNK